MCLCPRIAEDALKVLLPFFLSLSHYAELFHIISENQIAVIKQKQVKKTRNQSSVVFLFSSCAISTKSEKSIITAGFITTGILSFFALIHSGVIHPTFHH